MAERAPYNDLKLLNLLEDYTWNIVVENATTTAFKGHLWYFSEHLIGLAFLDPHVNVNTKAAMVKNLKRSEKNIPPKRIESKAFNLGTHWNHMLQVEHLSLTYSLIHGRKGSGFLLDTTRLLAVGSNLSPIDRKSQADESSK
jgi:hypothetical protein